MKLLDLVSWIASGVAFALLAMACGKTDGAGGGAPAFTGVMSMSMNLSASQASDSNYLAEYASGYAVGARGAQTVARWDSLDASGAVYNLYLASNAGYGWNSLVSQGFHTILVTVPIVAIASRSMPADIKALAFNHATVKARYRQLIDQLLPYLNSNVKYFSVGNEVDTYFSTYTGEVAAFKELVDDAITYLHQVRPNIKVGVTTTFEGATSTQVSTVSTLNQNTDVFIMTYYPIGSGFVARDPSSVTTDMNSMVNVAAGKPIVMQEWGYPTSTTLSGSAQKQSDFITNTFSLWKSHGSTKFPFISFFKRRDYVSGYCTTITGGQTAGMSFYEFMCSLGLVNNDQTPKAAWTALINGAQTAGVQ